MQNQNNARANVSKNAFYTKEQRLLYFIQWEIGFEALKMACIFLFELTDLGEVSDEGQLLPDVAARLLLGVRRSEFGVLEVDSFL